jgi:hypothetical protein
MPGDLITDAVPFLLECRRRGLVFRLADGQLAAGPQHLIDPDLAVAIRDRKEALVAALRAEQPPAPPLTWPTARVPPRQRLLVAPEAPGELERLAALLRAAEWPAEPFLVNRATLVTNPALAKRHLLGQAAADPPTGQVRRAVLARLRVLRRLAANGWRLTGGE